MDEEHDLRTRGMKRTDIILAVGTLVLALCAGAVLAATRTLNSFPS